MLDMLAVFLIIGIAAVVIDIYVGWYSRKKIHAPLNADPGIIVSFVVSIVPLLFTGMLESLMFIPLAVGGYMGGHYMGPTEHEIRIWQRETKDDKAKAGRITSVAYYMDKDVKYLVPKDIRDSLRSIIGIRDILELDTKRPHFLTSLSIDIPGNESEIDRIIPIARAMEPVETLVNKIRLGSRKNESGGRTTRYLVNSKFSVYKYIPADRMYQKPAEFFFDVDISEKAITDAAVARAAVSRLELELRTAKYDGVIDHIKEMCALDVDNPDLPDEIKVLAAAHRKKKQAEGKDALSEEIKKEISEWAKTQGDNNGGS